MAGCRDILLIQAGDSLLQVRSRELIKTMMKTMHLEKGESKD